MLAASFVVAFIIEPPDTPVDATLIEPAGCHTPLWTMLIGFATCCIVLPLVILVLYGLKCVAFWADCAVGRVIIDGCITGISTVIRYARRALPPCGAPRPIYPKLSAAERREIEFERRVETAADWLNEDGMYFRTRENCRARYIRYRQRSRPQEQASPGLLQRCCSYLLFVAVVIIGLLLICVLATLAAIGYVICLAFIRLLMASCFFRGCWKTSLLLAALGACDDAVIAVPVLCVFYGTRRHLEKIASDKATAAAETEESSRTLRGAGKRKRNVDYDAIDTTPPLPSDDMVEASKVDPKTLSWQVQQVLLYEVMNVGELQKPGGGRYETPMGVALAEERALRTATQEQIATALLLWDERATPTTLPKCDATGYVSTL